MRIHTIAWEMHRTAGKDDIIPLAFPIITKSGKTLSGIPVSKGQNIAISMCGYNRYLSLLARYMYLTRHRLGQPSRGVGRRRACLESVPIS